MALGEISTRSKPCSSAIAKACFVLYTPTSILSPTSRTSSTLILELILCWSSFITLGEDDLLLRIAMTSVF